MSHASLSTSDITGHAAYTPNIVLSLRLKIKRVMDILLACIACVLLSPLLLVIALLVKKDGGSVLFRQTRVGRNNKPFACYKFRSMHMDAEDQLADYLAQNPDAMAEWQSFQKLKHDVRITPFGNFLRSTSIDELPSLSMLSRGI